MICDKLKFKKFGFHLLSSTIENVFYCPGADKSKISAQPNTTLSIQFLDRENNDKNNTLPLGKQICLTIVWRCAKILPRYANKISLFKFKQVFLSELLYSTPSHNMLSSIRGLQTIVRTGENLTTILYLIRTHNSSCLGGFLLKSVHWQRNTKVCFQNTRVIK